MPGEPEGPVLMLDVDGVLNYGSLIWSGEADPICPIALSRLMSVIEKTGCSIVLSSSWRKIDFLVDKLRAVGVMDHAHPDWKVRSLGLDPDRGSGVAQCLRGREIAEWLGRHPEVLCYAILDDETDMLPEQMSFFVKTEFLEGLQDHHVEDLLAILGPARDEQVSLSNR